MNLIMPAAVHRHGSQSGQDWRRSRKVLVDGFEDGRFYGRTNWKHRRAMDVSG